MPRYFTLEEANTALNEIKPLIEEILTIRQHILDQREEVWPVIQRAAGNGGSQSASKLAIEFERVDALVHQIQATGVIVKDLNMGLLDFPHLKEGREVYLCWKHGEEGIAFWHEIEAGYAGRQPI
ncbi:MAG TPA: DUF2203 domain-containing protein [Anaerolineales bacterium]|nr:DUF2203 domain-containing protein [Anaerolineales bacterium]